MHCVGWIPWTSTYTYTWTSTYTYTWWTDTPAIWCDVTPWLMIPWYWQILSSLGRPGWWIIGWLSYYLLPGVLMKEHHQSTHQKPWLVFMCVCLYLFLHLHWALLVKVSSNGGKFAIIICAALMDQHQRWWIILTITSSLFMEQDLSAAVWNGFAYWQICHLMVEFAIIIIYQHRCADVIHYPITTSLLMVEHQST